MDQSPFEQASRHGRLVRPRRALALLLILIIAVPLVSGCQVTYLLKSAYHQTGLLTKRTPVEKALKDERLSDEQKRKLNLAVEARAFAETRLGLNKTDNYTNYVHLDRPYVTYVVSAAHRQELKPYTWWFPIVGSVPYKGYFEPDGAKEEARGLSERGYDTYVRGVTAYSTLGWFTDPILSSMLSYADHDLVDTIIHETVHATVYIKSSAEFNERLAVFIGQKGAEEFYKAKEGPDGPTLKLMRDDAEDERVFSEFIFAEIKALERWYAENKDTHIPEDERQAMFTAIKARFASYVKPRLRLANSYRGFENSELNNARIMNYRLYFDRLDEFEKVFASLGRDFARLLEFAKNLEKAKDPQEELTRAAAAGK